MRPLYALSIRLPGPPGFLSELRIYYSNPEIPCRSLSQHIMRTCFLPSLRLSSRGESQGNGQVDDGSTDQTVKSIRQFIPASASCVTSTTRKGSRYGRWRPYLSSGSDIFGCRYGRLTHKDLDRMVSPVVSGAAEMNFGAARFWSQERLNRLII